MATFCIQRMRVDTVRRNTIIDSAKGEQLSYNEFLISMGPPAIDLKELRSTAVQEVIKATKATKAPMPNAVP